MKFFHTKINQVLGGGLLGGTNTYSGFSQSSLYSTMSTGNQGGLLGDGLGNGLGTCLRGVLGSSLRGGLGSGSNSLYS